MTCTRDRILFILQSKELSVDDKIACIRHIVETSMCKCMPQIIEEMASFDAKKLEKELHMKKEDALYIACYFHENRGVLSERVAQLLVSMIKNDKKCRH